MSNVIEILDSLFFCKAQTGWTALFAAPGLKIEGFGTKRVGKLMDGELQFTIGSTELGRSAKLNLVIYNIIRAEGYAPAMNNSTSGQRLNAEYPTLPKIAMQSDVIRRVVHRVEGAILGVMVRENC